MELNIQDAIISQYIASLEMMRRAIAACPDWMWADVKLKNKFWHIAYHSVFFTHLYLSPSEEEFSPWEDHRDEYQFMGKLPWPPQNEPSIDEAYTKNEIQNFIAFCVEQVKAIVPLLDLESEESGFSWLPFNKLELQFYNIRHLQQHIGELCERLGSQAGTDANWVGMGSV